MRLLSVRILPSKIGVISFTTKSLWLWPCPWALVGLKDKGKYEKTAMKTINIMVDVPMSAANKKREEWWSAVILALNGMQKWKPIIAEGVFVLTSDVGSIRIDNHSFASCMMCDKQTWQQIYRNEFDILVKAIDNAATVKETDITV